MDGSGGKSSLFDFFHRCVWGLLIKGILQPWEQEGHLETDFVFISNSIRLRARLRGRAYFQYDPFYL